MNKKKQIKKLVIESLDRSVKEIKEKLIDKALNSGAVDVDKWSKDNNPMILPKSILIAVLLSEADQYSGVGTSFEKQVKKEVKNLRCFV